MHDIVYFQRHTEDDLTSSTPGREALESWPPKVRVKIRAVLAEVAKAPPYRFSGGGYWEAMHDEMAGFHEIRVDLGQTHYRLFCVIDSAADGAKRPYLTVIDGRSKPRRTALSKGEYAEVIALRREYLSREKRSLYAGD